MLCLKTVVIVALFGVFCMGVERSGWPGYEYEADIGGWLKVHQEPADWSTARATCHREDALLASPWSTTFTSTVTRIQASKSIPMMYSGAGLRSYSAGIPMEISENKRCFVFLAKGTTGKEICYTQLPFACYAPAPSCGSGYDYRSETGSCYKMHKDPQLMAGAISTCLSEGGYLAKLDGGDTEKLLLGKMTADVGESLTYIANDDGGIKYRHLFSSSTIDDYECNEKHPFICEKPLTKSGTDLRD